MKPKIQLAAALSLALFASACHEDDDSGVPGNQAPSIVFTSPLTPLTVEVGEAVEIRWIADDPDDEAKTNLTAVGLTVTRQIELVVEQPEEDGREQVFVWTPDAGEEGTYRLDAISTDGKTTTVVSAPGTVGVGTFAAASGAAALTEGGSAGSMDTFPDGSFVVTGYMDFSFETVVFDSGGPNETRLTSATRDAYVAKFAPDGEFLWARQTIANPLPAPGGQVDSQALPWDLVALPDGGCVLDVGFEGSVTVGLGTPNAATWFSPLGQFQELLICFDAAGGLRWSRPVYAAPGGGDSEFGSMAAVGDGTFVLTAERYGEMIFDLGGPNETIVTDDEYAYLAAFEDDGDLRFAVALAYSLDGSVDRPRVHANEQGIWVAGLFNGTATFGRGEPNETTLTALSDEDDQFLAFYDAQGALVWARHTAGVPFDDTADEILVGGMTTDASGALHVLIGPLDSGDYLLDVGGPNETSVQVSEEEQALVLAQYDSAGGLAWIRVLTAEYVGEYDPRSGTGLAAMETDGVVIAAFFEELIEGAGFHLEEELQPGLGTLFLARFDASGELQWALNDGGEESAAEIFSVVPLSGDRVLVNGTVGSFQGMLEFGTNETESTFLENPGTGMTYRVIYAGDGSL